jgi:cobalamin biosynthesis protein CobW
MTDTALALAPTAAASLARVPCTIVTGFLGAGKTTLVRHVLENAGGRRLAVIVNEFGDVGIDREVLKGCGIEACPEENIVELANGCLCCTVADDFVPALDAILSRVPRVDHILIETSGLALPKPLVQAFNWPSVNSRVTVDGVIAVVDGAALAQGAVTADPEALAAQRAADPALEHEDPVEEVFQDQIACADLVVMTKSDMIDADGEARARANLAASLPAGVRVITTSQGVLDPSVLLGLGLSAQDNIADRKTLHDNEDDHEHDDFASFILEVPEITAPAELADRIAKLSRELGVLRVKGHVAVAGKSMRLLVQAVGQRVSHQYDRAWEPQENRRGRLVVIGLRGLNEAAVAAALAG